MNTKKNICDRCCKEYGEETGQHFYRRGNRITHGRKPNGVFTYGKSIDEYHLLEKFQLCDDCMKELYNFLEHCPSVTNVDRIKKILQEGDKSLGKPSEIIIRILKY